MINIKKIIVLFLVLPFIYCKSQVVNISVKDIQSSNNLKLKVSLLVKNDTIFLKETKPNFYLIKESKNTFLIEYGNNKYFLNDIENDVKSIVIDYKHNAENGCFIVNKIFGDAIQSYNLNNLKDCSDITNVYLYNTNEPKLDIAPEVKLRKVNN